MVTFFIIGSGGSWMEIATWGPVRWKYTLVTIRQLPWCRIYGILWGFYIYGGSVSQCRLFSCWSFVPLHLYKMLLFLINRVDHSSNPDMGRVWNSGLTSEDWDIPSSYGNSLNYFWVDVYFHHFEMLTLHWGNVVIQPWIFEMSKILLIRTNALSAFPRCFWTWAVDRDRLNWNRLRSQCQHLLTIPPSSSSVTVFSNVLPSGVISYFSLIPLYPQFWHCPLLDTI